MKKGLPDCSENPDCGAKGTPFVYWYSAVSSAFRDVGYLAGYLTGCFSLVSFHAPAPGVAGLPTCPFTSSVLFSGGGRGTPPYSGLSLLAKRAAGHRAKRWPSPLLSVFFTPFSRLFYIFFDFLHFYHISFFRSDTPGVLRFFGFFCSVVVVCDTPWFWLVFNVSWLFCVDGSSITQSVLY